ncbi:hypothetical protein DFP72DRAFT_1141468 [Ephemerocybe angulata]|uniref:Uncharacterized protein n=1 Tax=Ephemerocybe angulata TaxID=980116 RepID=A0A8H6HQ96_9AGAR|nr:hypothetical protein DFP72DRAFT_1141468 [Tulosesus angulatus]
MDITDAPFDKCVPHTPEDHTDAEIRILVDRFMRNRHLIDTENRTQTLRKERAGQLPSMPQRIVNRKIIDAEWDKFLFIPRELEEDTAVQGIKLPRQSILNSKLVHLETRTQALRICTPEESWGKPTVIYRGADDSEDWVAKIDWMEWVGVGHRDSRVFLPPPSYSMLKVEMIPSKYRSDVCPPDTEKITFSGGKEYRWHAPLDGPLSTTPKTMYQMVWSAERDNYIGAPLLHRQVPHPRAVTCIDRNTGRVELKIDRAFKDLEVAPGLTLLDLVAVFSVVQVVVDDRVSRVHRHQSFSLGILNRGFNLLGGTGKLRMH